MDDEVYGWIICQRRRGTFVHSKGRIQLPYVLLEPRQCTERAGVKMALSIASCRTA